MVAVAQVKHAYFLLAPAVRNSTLYNNVVFSLWPREDEDYQGEKKTLTGSGTPYPVTMITLSKKGKSHFLIPLKYILSAVMVNGDLSFSKQTTTRGIKKCEAVRWSVKRRRKRPLGLTLETTFECTSLPCIQKQLYIYYVKYISTLFEWWTKTDLAGSAFFSCSGWKISWNMSLSRSAHLMLFFLPESCENVHMWYLIVYISRWVIHSIYVCVCVENGRKELQMLLRLSIPMTVLRPIIITTNNSPWKSRGSGTKSDKYEMNGPTKKMHLCRIEKNTS